MARKSIYDKEAGKIRKYQLNPKWDEMTAAQRAEFEELNAEDREAYLERLEYEESYYGGDDNEV
jgi:hypothetical protein